MTSTDPVQRTAQSSDPELFGPLALDENTILRAHLTSGWYKQSAVYDTLSEPWQETAALLDDLGSAWDAAFQASRPEAKPAPQVQPELAEPEPGAGL